MTLPASVFRFYKERDRDFAEDFVKNGRIRFYPQKHYTKIEDDSRSDTTEGLGEIHRPDKELAQIPFPGKNVSRVVGLMSYGSVSLDHVYIFCTSLPDVNRVEMSAKMGPIIVEIFDLTASIAAIRSAVAIVIGNERCFDIEAFRVRYDKGEMFEGEISEEEIHKLSYKQKPRKHESECEFRFVVGMDSIAMGAEREFLELSLKNPSSFVRFLDER